LAKPDNTSNILLLTPSNMVVLQAEVDCWEC